MRNNEERIGANVLKQDATPPQQMLQEVQKDNQQSLNFITPTEYVALPSKGRFYPPNHPLHMQETVEIKQMTAKEEDILTSRNLIKKGVALDKLIQSIVVNKAINTDTLLMEDRNAILVAARMSAYGSEYETTVSCPSCSTKAKYTFDLAEKLDQVEKAEGISVDIDERGLFSLKLPKSNWIVKCRALNGYDEKAIFKLSENKKDNDSLIIEQLKMMIVAINNVSVETDKATVLLAIENMPAKDSKYIRSVYGQIVPNVDLKNNFICNKCEYEAVLEVPLSADFFWFK